VQQRSQAGWIGGQKREIIFSRALRALGAAALVLILQGPVTAGTEPQTKKADKPGKKEKILYGVKKGDTLQKIASRFNVEVQAIMDWNKEAFAPKPKTEEPEAAPAVEEGYPTVLKPGILLKIPLKGPDGKAVTHKVKGGETFIGIAHTYGVTKAKLYKWNKKVLNPSAASGSKAKAKKAACQPKKGKKGKKNPKGKKVKDDCAGNETDTIWPGMQIVLWAERPDLGPRIAAYRAKNGDTPLAIAKKYNVRMDDLLDFNFMAKSDVLSADEIVDVPLPLPVVPSESVGSPSAGKLIHGERMLSGPGYDVKSPDYAFGTNETITQLITCIAQVQRDYPDTHDLVIGHLSKKSGGRFKPHKSHASGRDADVGYFLSGLKPGKFIKATAANLDLERTMDFILCLVDSGQLEYIFVNYPIQKLMQAYMLKQNKDEAFVSKLIQFPNPVEKRVAYIRHEPGHDDHMHIRFICPKSSPNCQE
jgi:LysM repeat protein